MQMIVPSKVETEVTGWLGDLTRQIGSVAYAAKFYRSDRAEGGPACAAFRNGVRVPLDHNKATWALAQAGFRLFS